MPRPTSSPLRRSLRASMLEGGVSETWNAFATGAVLTAWSLHLGADPSTIAILQGLSTGAQILHGPAGFVTEWVGRKRLAIVALTGARLAWAPMAALPLLHLEGSHATMLLIAVSALSALLQVLGQNAWGAWMGDMIPPTLRGRFFGARTVFVTGGAALASLACALLLESEMPREVTLPLTAALLCTTGLVSASLLARQMDPLHTAKRTRPDLKAYATALRDPNARGLYVYQLLWGAAVAPGAAFFSLHVLGTCHASFFLLAAHAVAVAITRVLTAPLWGRAVDRWGARPVLAVCSVGVSLMPASWILLEPGRLWPLALDAICSGLMWGGHGVASFDLPLGIAPAPRRSYYLALFATAAGFGFAVSTVGCGFAADWISVHADGDLRPLFLLSAFARAACGLVAARLVHEPQASSVRSFIGGVRRRVIAR